MGKVISPIMFLDSLVNPTSEMLFLVKYESLRSISLKALKNKTFVELPLSMRICLIKKLATQRDITKASWCGWEIHPPSSFVKQIVYGVRTDCLCKLFCEGGLTLALLCHFGSYVCDSTYLWTSRYYVDNLLKMWLDWRSRMSLFNLSFWNSLKICPTLVC